MRTVKAITGMSAAEKFYEKLSGAIRYVLPAATALAFLSLGTDAKAQMPSNDITLTSVTINENEAVGTAVGFLSTDDPDFETHSYSLVSGAGDDDNASFSILANKLQSNEIFNFEVKNTYSVRIASTGDDGLIYEKPFTISVGDVNDKPSINPVVRSTEWNTTLDIALTDFQGGFTDEDGHALDKVEVTSLPSVGVLRLGITPITIGQILSAADCDDVHYDAPDSTIGNLIFEWKGEDGSEYSDDAGSFVIRVRAPRQGTSGTGLTSDSISLLDRVGGGINIVRDSVLSVQALGGSSSGTYQGTRSSISTDSLSGSKMSAESTLTGLEGMEDFDLNVTAYPNPFATTAQIQFTLPEAAIVEVNIYNYMGAMVKQLVTGMQPSGNNVVTIGNSLSAGSYIYTVKVQGNQGETALFHTGKILKLQ